MTEEMILRVLKEMRSLLTPRNAWIQQVEAADKYTEVASVRNENATRYCLLGAAQRAEYNLTKHITASCEELVACALGFQDSDIMTEWNDEHKRQKRAVLARIDRTIAKYEAIHNERTCC